MIVFALSASSLPTVISALPSFTEAVASTPFSFSSSRTLETASLVSPSLTYSSTDLSRSRSIALSRPSVSTALALGDGFSLAEVDAVGDSETVGAAAAGMKLEPTTKAVAAAATMPRCAVFLFGCGINASPRFTVRVPAPTLPQDARIGTGVVTKMKHYLVAPLFFKHRIQRKYKFNFLFGLVKIR